MSSFEICEKLLMSLETSMKYWGRIIDNFIQNYKSLQLDERELLSQKIPVSIRYALMIQYLEHFSREHETVSKDKLSNMIENSIYLISLDNFEYDYRETILRVVPFIESTKSHNITFQDVWGPLQDQMPERTINKILHFI